MENKGILLLIGAAWVFLFGFLSIDRKSSTTESYKGFKSNYLLDCKDDCYQVKSRKGEITEVEFGELEEFLEKDL